ncbi:MAG TPA: LPS assembly lipoprotein LptE [Polyangiaceae bacterium]|nr:LPS assembly lipoprotein LptE [Polyangiaceae bacterium]
MTALGLALASSSLDSSAAAASPGAVSIGDVQIAPDASAPHEALPELGRTLRAALTDELSRVGLSQVKRPLIVSATLTRLSSERRDERTKTTATISLALRRADDQVLFAELRGRASVEESTNNAASLRRAALQGAVRGAVARLPEVVQRTP